MAYRPHTQGQSKITLSSIFRCPFPSFLDFREASQGHVPRHIAMQYFCRSEHSSNYLLLAPSCLSPTLSQVKLPQKIPEESLTSSSTGPWEMEAGWHGRLEVCAQQDCSPGPWKKKPPTRPQSRELDLKGKQSCCLESNYIKPF